MGAFHMKHALEAEVSPPQSERMRQYLLIEDEVLFIQAAIVMGKEGLRSLAAEYIKKRPSANYEAARCKFGLVELIGASAAECAPILKEAHELLDELGPLSTRGPQQLVYAVLQRYQWLQVLSDIFFSLYTVEDELDLEHFC